MTWFKVDDEFPRHSKVKALRTRGARVRADALALWTIAGCECAAALRDGGVIEGFVSYSDVEACMSPTPPKDSRAAAEALADVGLWHRVEGGYLFHDWTEYQPSSDDVKKERDRWKRSKRMSRGRPADVPAGQARDSSPMSTACPETPVPVPVPPSSMVGCPEPEPSDLRDTIRHRWARTYEQARGQMSIAADSESTRALVPVLEANAVKRGETPAALLEAILAAYWREPWPRQHSNRASLANLVRQFDRLLAALGTPKRTEAFDPSRHTATTPDEERAVNDWIAAGCPALRRTA